MKSTILLLWLWVCTAASEPLRAALQRRSDRPGIYASDFANGYRPYTYIAVPLHEPLPVLRVLASEPLHRPHRGVTRHIQQQPRIYAASMDYKWYAPSPTRQHLIHPPLIRQPVIHQPLIHQPVIHQPLAHQEVESAPAPEILYARPKPGGGFVYSKRPSKKRKPTKPVEPMIIRIHKYRIVRDR